MRYEGPGAKMGGAERTERGSEEERPARATAPEPAERDSDEASESLGGAQDNRRETKRDRGWRSSGGAKAGAENARKKARISRTTEASGTQPCTTCGTQAEGATGPQREDVPHRGHGEGLRGREAAPTAGPRLRTREPAPRPVPPAEARRRPDIRSGDQAGATEEAAARQTAKNESFPAADGKQPIL